MFYANFFIAKGMILQRFRSGKDNVGGGNGGNRGNAAKGAKGGKGGKCGNGRGMSNDYRKNYEHAHLILKNLWLGNMQAARDSDFIRENNIRFVLNCTKDIPNYHENEPWGPSYYRIPVDDSLMKKDFIVMTEYLFHVVPYLSLMLAKGITIFVHCYAGMQRSACVVAALLVRHQMPLYKAIEFIQKRRRIAFTPQVNFIDSLLLYTVNNQ